MVHSNFKQFIRKVEGSARELPPAPEEPLIRNGGVFNVVWTSGTEYTFSTTSTTSDW